MNAICLESCATNKSSKRLPWLHRSNFFLFSYRELGSLLHDLIPQQSWGNGPLLLLLTSNRVRHGTGAAGVLYRGLQSPVHLGPCHRALEGWWRPAPAASVHAAWLTLTFSLVVLPGRPGDRWWGRAAGHAAQRWGSLWTSELAATSWQGSVHGHRDRHKGWCHLPELRAPAPPWE